MPLRKRQCLPMRLVSSELRQAYLHPNRVGGGGYIDRAKVNGNNLVIFSIARSHAFTYYSFFIGQKQS